jgi:hypothetical protein
VKVNDFGKLGFLLAVLIVVAVLAVLHVVETSLVSTVILIELGYVTGNGVLAKRGQAPWRLRLHRRSE